MRGMPRSAQLTRVSAKVEIVFMTCSEMVRVIDEMNETESPFLFAMATWDFGTISK